MDAGEYTASAAHRLNHGLVAPGANPDADPENPLFGRVVVFTGALQTMTRQLAWEEVGRAGGLPEPAVTKRTNILVIGDINPAFLAPGTEITGKAAKAFALQRRGQEIEVMTEDDFLRSL
jgi:NAD-dependent DNA ligase